MALKVWSSGEQLAAAELNNNFSEVGGSSVAFYPVPAYAVNSNGSSINPSSSTTGYVGSFILPTSSTVNKISFYVSTVTTSGTMKIGIYSSDGQTQFLNDTTGTISTGGAAYTHTLSSAIALTQGQYYFVLVPVGTTNIAIHSFERRDAAAFLNTITNEPKLFGTMTVTAGTLPTTFNTSTGITDSINGLLPIMRFDN